MRQLQSPGIVRRGRGSGGAAGTSGRRCASGSAGASPSRTCRDLVEAARLLIAGIAIASRPSSSPAAEGTFLNNVRRHRRGALLMEMIAATALFGILLLIVVPIVTGVAAIRETARQQQAAQIELGNVLEQIAARHRQGAPVRDIVPTIQLSPEVSALLPESKLAFDVSESADVYRAVRVSAGLTWSTGADRPDASAELHAFYVEAARDEEFRP